MQTVLRKYHFLNHAYTLLGRKDDWHRFNHVREPTSIAFVMAVMAQHSNLFPDEDLFASVNGKVANDEY